MDNFFKLYNFHNLFLDKGFVIISILEEPGCFRTEMFILIKERGSEFVSKALNFTVHKNITLILNNNQTIEEYLLLEGINSSREILRQLFFEKYKERPEFLYVDSQPIKLIEINISHIATSVMSDKNFRSVIDNLADFIRNDELRKFMDKILKLPSIVSFDPFKKDPFYR